ncbi:MAG: beta-lactamase family protein [Chloroflexota bacterium]|nr:beta-lactamase family protein [Chloroflexota bacterium]
MINVQAQVQSCLDDLVGRGVERGLQVAAYLDGERVVDAWAGIADPATGRPVDGETLFTVFSCTKGVTATVIHQLAERGILDYDAPVASYWPEFGTHGKERITVRHVLSHTAGVPQMPAGGTPTDMADWDGVCRAIADLTPLWEPGTATGYHGLTYGFILGEVARRVDGRAIAQIVQEDICQPLGISSLFFGIPDAAEPRVAPLENDRTIDDAPAPPLDSYFERAMPGLRFSNVSFNLPALRRASIPAAGGIMNARALAQHYAALVGDGVQGVRLLTPNRVEIATTLQSGADDLVTGMPGRKALGYTLGGPLSPFSERITAFGHGGYGGATGFADPQHKLAFALAKNRLAFTAPDESAANLVARALRTALGIPEAD